MVQSIAILKSSGRPEVQDVGPGKFGSQALEKALQDKVPSALSQLFSSISDNYYYYYYYPCCGAGAGGAKIILDLELEPEPKLNLKKTCSAVSLEDATMKIS